nr:MAG TPA: hypothetical protein [Caudoviricetes sp.]
MDYCDLLSFGFALFGFIMLCGSPINVLKIYVF